MLSIGFYGATGTVTGSKFVVSAGEEHALVDCGLFQGLKELRLRNWDRLPFSIDELDAVFLTHAHIDHSGYLPRLVKSGYSGPIYATGSTVDLCRILLPDSAELQEEEARHANKRGYSKHSPALPLYNVSDAEACLRQFSAISYEQRRPVGQNMFLRFQDAGHILGSAIAEIWLNDRLHETKVVFSGDLGRYGDEILKDPTPIAKADYVVVESTYGDRQHPAESVADALAAVVNEIVERKSILLIPAFAVGRTQQLIYHLHKLEKCQAIPSVPIYVDSPMAIDATSIFLDHREDHRLDFRRQEEDRNEANHPLRCEHLTFVRSAKESAALDLKNGPAIIISASGMAAGGRVLNHLEAFLPDPNAIILFAGFQAAGTRGRSLIDGAEAVKMHGQMVPVRAQIRRLDSLSAHGDADDVLRWLGTLEKAPIKVFLVHGEPASSEVLAQRIRQQLGFETYIPHYGEVVTLQGN